MNLKYAAAGIRLTALVAFILSALIAPTAEANGQHQQGSDYAYWQFQGPGNDFYQVDQIMWLDRKAAYTYWAMQFRFTGSDDAGYIGLQTKGVRFDNTVGDTAIFSLWNANGIRGSSCGTFTGEGDGYSCRIPFTIRTGVGYRLRVWRLESDNNGQWWGGWIRSDYSGHEYHIGDIRVPAEGHHVLGQVMNFSEYFGPAVPCNQVPRSIIHLTQPAANSHGDAIGRYSYYSRFAGFGKLECTGGSATPKDYGWTQGVRLVLGGPQNVGRALP